MRPRSGHVEATFYLEKRGLNIRSGYPEYGLITTSIRTVPENKPTRRVSVPQNIDPLFERIAMCFDQIFNSR